MSAKEDQRPLLGTPNDRAAAQTTGCAAVFDVILLIVLLLILLYVCASTVAFSWWRIVHVALVASAVVACADPRFYVPVWFAVLAFFALLADAFLAGEQWALFSAAAADPFVDVCALSLLVVAVAFVIVDIIYLSSLSLALRSHDFDGAKTT